METSVQSPSRSNVVAHPTRFSQTVVGAWGPEKSRRSLLRSIQDPHVPTPHCPLFEDARTFFMETQISHPVKAPFIASFPASLISEAASPSSSDFHIPPHMCSPSELTSSLSLAVVRACVRNVSCRRSATIRTATISSPTSS